MVNQVAICYDHLLERYEMRSLLIDSPVPLFLFLFFFLYKKFLANAKGWPNSFTLILRPLPNMTIEQQHKLQDKVKQKIMQGKMTHWMQQKNIPMLLS